MKVAELESAQLDYWVARAEDVSPRWEDNDTAISALFVPNDGSMEGRYRFPYGPSSNWAQGGPIIERERIAMFPAGELGWAAFIQGPNCHYVDTTAYDEMRGPTPLTAAMRAYVASKFGDEVPDQVA